MRVGFTGTREGMSQFQKEELILQLYKLVPTEFHHGDCVGADEEAHEIVRQFFPDSIIVVHPPKNPYKRAYKVGDVTMYVEDYLPRDMNIVNETEFLIGAPLVNKPTKSSGTWFTIEYAQSLKRPHRILQR